MCTTKYSYSNFQDVVSGVTQWYFIGSLLFLIYINDLSSIIKPLYISLFADDAKIIRTSTSLVEIQKLQAVIDTISEWMNTYYENMQIYNTSTLHYG